MGVSAKDVKELRDRTNAPMMECRTALEESGGDIEQAIKLLRERGIAKAAKRADRDTAEGLVRVSVGEGNRGAVAVQVSCETDFSARNEAFVRLADQAIEAARRASGDVAATLDAKLASGRTLREALDDAKNQIRENMDLRRVVRFAGTAGGYQHFDGRSGALVEVKAGDAKQAASPELATLLREVCMHIVATVPSPVAVDAAGIPPELVEQEKEIFVKQAIDSGKPREIAEKMVAGRIKKFTAERALLEQPFIKDPTKTVAQVIAERAKALGTTIEVVRFERLQVGG